MLKMLTKILIISIFFIQYDHFAYADDVSVFSKFTVNTKRKLIFKNNNDKMSYALGISLGNYIDKSLQEQKKLGVYLNTSQFILGINNSILKKSQLSIQEISELLKLLENRLIIASKEYLNTQSRQNDIISKNYLNNFSKKKGVKQTQSGLFYLIKKKGVKSVISLNKSIYTVHYIGKLVNGKEFDNSYIRRKPFSFTLNSVIPAWKEGLQLIGKGGKIMLVVPPVLAYGNIEIPGIPINSTLIFEIEILNITN